MEARTVNHRHFTASLKLCNPLQQFEGAVRDRLREEIARGHVTLTARWIEEPERPVSLRVNVDRARDTLRALRELKRELELPGEVDLAFLARQPDVITAGTAAAPEVDESELLAVVGTAVADLVAMREREGTALGNELRSLLSEMGDLVTAVERRAPERLIAERDRLRDSVAELLDGRAIDEQRLNQEIALLADRLDITEEMVRLRTHIDACSTALDTSGPVGRHLSFLGQEMLREINTIGSKANDGEIAGLVIAMKGVVEKMREQVENLE